MPDQSGTNLEYHCIRMNKPRSVGTPAVFTRMNEPPSFQNDSVSSRPYDPFANSVALRTLKKAIVRAASTNATVLFTGERGVGKELAARVLHQESPRPRHLFIRVNCAGRPEDLLDEELFGHGRGAFPGDHRRKPGKFGLANGGSLFLDEISEMPLALQVKLLLVLQARELSGIDSRHEASADVRVIAATNRDLAELVEQGRFRKDLHDRLSAVTLQVPPLRERREEIPRMVEHFLDRYTRQYPSRRTAILPATMELFHVYPWPGNIRELENTIKRIVVLGTQDWLVQGLRGLPTPTWSSPQRATTADAPQTVPTLADDGPSLTAIARAAALQAERGVLKQVLDRVHWNRRAAARVLKVSYRTLRRKIEQCGLED
jgi:DNA-binding NtrC family response regulator